MFQVTSIDQAGVALGRILPLRAIGHLIVQEAKVAMLQEKEDGRPRPIIHQGTCPMVTRHQQVRNKLYKTYLTRKATHLVRRW